MSAPVTREPGELHADPTHSGPGWNQVSVTWARIDGRPVVVKSGTGRHRDALRREAALLAALPDGVAVDIVRVDDGDHVTSLVTHEVTAARDPEGSAERIGHAAQACRALARLHRAGWAHGRVDSGHLLFGPDGVRLCSLGTAVSIAGHPDAGRSDISQLRALLGDRLDPRSGRTRRERRRLGQASRSVEEHLCVPEPELAALEALAGALEAMAARSTPVAIAWTGRRRAAPPPGRTRGARRSSRGRLMVSALSVMAAGVVLLAAIRIEGCDGPAWERPLAGTATAAVDRKVRSGCWAAGSTDPDVDGDGCGDDVEVDGRTIRLGRSRFQVGSPGDVARLGDWDCDGRATVLLLRPSTGELFEFREWAAPGAPVAVNPAAVVAGARTLPPPGSAACPEPAVHTDDGTDVVVEAVRSHPGASRP